MQTLSAGPAETAKLYRISDLIPKSWDGSPDKGQLRNFIAELHWWMQARSDQSERILVRFESVGKVERSTLAADCVEADFRTFETALCQILHRTTTNEPLRMVQVQGQRGFEVWHMIVRRYDQSNTSDRSSASAALISNISERGRATNGEQLDDILRNFIVETNMHEGGYAKIRDEEKILAVRKLMPESLLKYRLRGKTLPYEGLAIALENIMDKVRTRSASKVKKNDTSAPLDIGRAAVRDGKETFEEGCGKTSELAVQAVYKGKQGPKVDGTEERVPVGVYRDTSTAVRVNRAGKGQLSKTARKEEKDKSKVAKR